MQLTATARNRQRSQPWSIFQQVHIIMCGNMQASWVWSAPNATGYMKDAERYLGDSPSAGVLHTSMDYSPPSYFEGNLMQVGW